MPDQQIWKHHPMRNALQNAHSWSTMLIIRWHFTNAYVNSAITYQFWYSAKRNWGTVRTTFIHEKKKSSEIKKKENNLPSTE